MKKSELIKALKEYPEDKEVFITLPGARQIFNVDVITTHEYGGNPVLETEVAPEFDDVEGMAEECFNEHRKYLTPWQVDALAEISDMVSKRRFA